MIANAASAPWGLTFAGVIECEPKPAGVLLSKIKEIKLLKTT